MEILLKISLLISVPIISYGQDFQTAYKSHCETNDTIAQKEILEKWEKAQPNDPELYTSYFNYHFMKATKEVIALTNEMPNGEGFELRDSSNEIVGYLGNGIYLDPVEIQKSFDKIDQGIKMFPNRLDMRFGKIYGLGQIADWEQFTIEIINSIDYSDKNHNNWTWTNNKKLEDGAGIFLSSIQDYQIQLYNLDNDSLLINMRQIATAILKYYPEHVESLSNLSITYLLLGEYDKAIEPLLKAERIKPEDYIVSANLAQSYKLKGDKNKAIEYYKKMIQFGDEEAIEYAKQQIEELQN